jgi:hypothetical protein
MRRTVAAQLATRRLDKTAEAGTFEPDARYYRTKTGAKEKSRSIFEMVARMTRVEVGALRRHMR